MMPFGVQRTGSDSPRALLSILREGVGSLMHGSGSRPSRHADPRSPANMGQQSQDNYATVVDAEIVAVLDKIVTLLAGRPEGKLPPFQAPALSSLKARLYELAATQRALR